MEEGLTLPLPLGAGEGLDLWTTYVQYTKHRGYVRTFTGDIYSLCECVNVCMNIALDSCIYVHKYKLLLVCQSLYTHPVGMPVTVHTPSWYAGHCTHTQLVCRSLYHTQLVCCALYTHLLLSRDFLCIFNFLPC